MTAQLNWAGNYTYRAHNVQRPDTLERLQELVANSESVRALGSRHSFNSIADTRGTLISLQDIDADITLDRAARTVTLGGGTKYGTLADELSRQGFA